MLTAKENFRECIRGGHPDRYVNQYEALQLMFSPYTFHSNLLLSPGQKNVVSAWGVTNSFPEGTPGSFPVHTPDKIVVKDIEDWKEYVKAPKLDYPEEEWFQSKEVYDSVDGNMVYKPIFINPGLFEHTHHLCSMEAALCYYITNPDEMHDLIRYITDWELTLADKLCTYLKPDAIFHHDDWGTEDNSFLRPSMFEDFFVDAYKEIYGYYHDHGVELVIHHSDSYAANLVPAMIEMGIDVWQGCMYKNNVPELVKKYGGKISFMGNIDNKFVDFDGWTKETCEKAAKDALDACGMNYYIPCISQGGPGSVYPGTYQAIADAIDALNAEKCGCTVEDLKAARLPLQILF